MTIAQTCLAELKHESIVTRKMLERVPFDHKDWKPHEKSMSLLKLSHHVASLLVWVDRTINQDEVDLATFVSSTPTAARAADLVEEYDKNLKRAEDILSTCSDDELMKPWNMRRGEIIFFTMPKAAALRNLAMNHLIHHRGQLSVYLRLLDVPVPGAYGPSADGE